MEHMRRDIRLGETSGGSVSDGRGLFSGTLEVIVGGMFSGKTETLITRLRRAVLARQKTQIFKPAIDDRYETHYIVSHNTMRLPTVPVSSAGDILAHLERGVQVVGIDEGQFLGMELVQVCRYLVQMGCRVIVAGLDMDYRGEPFEPMPQLMALADEVTKQHAICVRCGRPALFSQRLAVAAGESCTDGGRVQIGGADCYEARCRRCFVPGVVSDVPIDISILSARYIPTASGTATSGPVSGSGSVSGPGSVSR